MIDRASRVRPAPGQESVWDYPRPPRLEPCPERVRVIAGGETVADTTRAFRVLETSHPPGMYIPPADIRTAFLTVAPGQSLCEYKGMARYWTLDIGDEHVAQVAWSYPDPTPPFRQIKDFLSFYPGRVDACWIGDEQVTPQEGGFYGGWITSRVVGPFKGAPGTMGW